METIDVEVIVFTEGGVAVNRHEQALVMEAALQWEAYDGTTRALLAGAAPVFVVEVAVAG